MRLLPLAIAIVLVSLVARADSVVSCDSSTQVCSEASSSKTHVSCSTTAGPLLIKLLPNISPLGVQRLQQMVESGFFGTGSSASPGVPIDVNVPGKLVRFV